MIKKSILPASAGNAINVFFVFILKINVKKNNAK